MGNQGVATKALEALNIPRPDMDFAESVYDLMGDWRKPEGISTAKLRLDAFKELQNVCNLPDEQRELWMQTQPETMQDLVRTAVEWNTLPPQRAVTTPPEQEETDETGKQKGKTKSTTTTPPPHRPVSKLTALMKYLEADEIKSVKEARLIH